jgi:thiol-disulfide isomerase/thioredoxin
MPLSTDNVEQSSAQRVAADPGSGVTRASRLAIIGVMACAALVFVATGCGSPLVKEVRNEAEFRDLVASADKPILMDFFKGGCAACMMLDGTIDHLAEDYDGRVIVAKFELMKFWFEVSNMPLWKEYRVGLYPTVVLIVDGKEKKRWVSDYSINNYRKELTELVGPPVEKPKDGKDKPAEAPVAAKDADSAKP